MSAARYFVFIEFTDPEVRRVLNLLRRSLNGKRVNDEAHVTVRGPYTQRPDPELLKQWGEILHGEAIFIADVGRFETPKGYAVFLHAKSRVFDNIWWKPDFSGGVTRKTPHVTIFETAEKKSALAVNSFLEAEAIQIVTHGCKLTVYTSKQHTLLSEDDHILAARKKSPPERITIKDNLFDRAIKLHKHLENPESNPLFQQMLL